MKRVFIILTLLAMASCTTKQKTELKSNKIEPERWIVINLETGDGEFILFNDGDSLIHKNWDYKLLKQDSGNGWVKKFKKVNERVAKSRLTGAEKDSIYSWTSKLVSTPASPLHVCTDYVGHLKVVIIVDNYPEIKQTCEYHSICDWKVINSETKKLYNFFLSKFPSIKE